MYISLQKKEREKTTTTWTALGEICSARLWHTKHGAKPEKKRRKERKGPPVLLQPPILLSYFRVMDSTDWYGAASSRRPQSHPASPHSAWIIQLLLLLHPTFLPSYAMLFNLQSLLAAAARAGVIHIYTAICGRFPDSPSYFPSVSPTCWAGLGPVITS